jgi:hypothetical protein
MKWDIWKQAFIIEACQLFCFQILNPLHTMSWLDWLGRLTLKLPQLKRLARCYSLSPAFLSVNGIKCDILMLRGKNRLSHYLRLWSFEGSLWKYCGYFCTTAFTPKQPWYFWEAILWQRSTEIGLSYYWSALIFSSQVLCKLIEGRGFWTGIFQWHDEFLNYWL